MSLQDLEDRLKYHKTHAFCKRLLSKKRKLYKCPQKFITVIRFHPDDYRWYVYVDPKGYEGCFSGCCKYSAMIDALDSRFDKEHEKEE